MNIKSIKRYLPRKNAYMDQDLRVWQPLGYNRQEYFYNGLNVKKEKENVIGEDIEQKDLVIVFNTIIEGTGHYISTLKGVIINRTQFLDNLLK